MMAPPYPSITRSKGWRFELDMERARQSDTWALAGPELRPWLLMLWAVAWEQVPAGSLPAEDALIAAHIGMPADRFAASKVVLMRGWWLADDGRLYHDVLVTRVRAMEKVRERERLRKAGYRLRVGPEVATESAQGLAGDDPAPKLSDGIGAESVMCPTGQQRDSVGRDATGTGTYKTHSSGEPDLLPGFVRFWDAWPKSDRKVAKAECAKRWKKWSLEAITDQIVAHVEASKRTRQWVNGYEPAPLTYLNQRRWQGELPEAGNEAAGYSVEADPRFAGAQ